MSVKENLLEFNTTLPDEVKLVAISKYQPIEVIQEAYDAGHRVFGENKVQELAEKQVLLPDDIEWHMVGHLQSNKVKYIAPFVNLIHSVDSLKLMREINKQGAKNNRQIKGLLQFHIATEESKFGLSLSEVEDILNSETFKEFEYLKIVGVMGMASFVSSDSQIRVEFKELKNIFDHLKSKYFNDHDFSTISMGMSGDYQIAIEEGSNCIRIGTSIFGDRN